MAQATEALATDTRNAADVEALMLKAGLISELGAETTATIAVDAAKLKELVDTKVLTQAEAELLAMKAGVTLQSTKEAATLIASNAKLGSSFAIMGKTAGAALKGIGKGLLSFASAHPVLAIGATIIGSVAFFNSELKKLEKEQEELIANAKALQEEYRNFAKDTSGKINSLTSQADEFNELSKGVDKYGNNISLASDEYDRYKSIVAEILGYSPELIQGYDAEGNAIADKNGLLERSIELLKEEQRLKLKEMTTDEKTGEAYDAAEAGWQQVQGYEGANTRNEIARWFDNNALRGGVNYEVDIAEVLGIKDEWKEEGNNLQNAIINNIDTVVKNIKDKKAELLAISDSDGNAIFSVDEIDNMIDLSNDWQYAYNQWQQDIEDAKHGMDDQFDLYAQRAKSYNDLTDAQKVFVNEYIRATGDITDAEGHLLSEDKILEKAKGYEKFVNEFAELNKLGEGGSVDLTFRPEIDTEELNKKGWEAGEGFATVFSSAISNTDFEDLMPTSTEDTVAINFTPIIVDPNTGEFKGVLSEEELYAYAHDVLAGVREDDLNLQIGAKFEGKNAIDEAVADGERIHYLHEKLFINNDTVDSWEELRKVLVKTGDDAVQAGENANKMTVSLSELKTASDNISSLSSAFKEISDDGYLSVETISKIQEATKLSGEEWESYKTKLLNAKAGSAEFNQIMSEMTLKVLEASFAATGLENATEDEIEAILRENGVVNASALAHEYSAIAKGKAKAKTSELLDEVDDAKSKLIEEAESCGISTAAYAQLVAQEIIFNNNDLDISDKISKLATLQQALGQTTSAAIGLNSALAGQSIDGRLEMSMAIQQYGIKRTAKGYEYNGITYNSGKDAVNAAMMADFTKNLKIDIPKVDYSGAITGKSGKDLAKDHLEKARDYAEKVTDIQEDLAEKEADFAKDMAEAWKEEHLAQLEDGLEKQKDIIDRYKKNIEVLDFGLEHIDADDFGSRTNILSSKLDNLKSSGSAMRAEFDRIANTIPNTAEEATALANRIEELGSDMRNNVSLIRETTVELQKLTIDMANALVDDRMSELQSELDNIDKRIKILNSDYKDEYQYASKVLSMDMLLPVYSEFDEARRKKQRSDRELINVEQETQDEINRIVTDSLERQAKANAKARAEERARLIEDMEKARKDAEKKLADAHQDYLDFLDDNEIATTNSVQEISDIFANADIKLPEIDISSVDDAISKVREKVSGIFDDGTKGGSIVNAASKYDGTPYTWGGGHGSDHSTLDCSGFVSAVLMDLGYIQTAYNADGFKSVGTKIDPSEMQPGDLLIFDYKHDGKADHVAFYAGDGKMWHSSGNSSNNAKNPGKGVHLADFSDFYRDALVQVNRVYAAGTPGGNARSGRLGLAGENYKPEILIDKATGKATYIDTPTVIDTTKTDVIGEKQTARLPKFADGTGVASEEDWIITASAFYDKAANAIGQLENDTMKAEQNVLSSTDLSDSEKTERLFGIKRDAALNASRIGAGIYNDLLYSYNEWQKALENDTAEWSLEVYEAYKDAFAIVDDLTYNMADAAVQAEQDSANLKWENSTNWIEERNEKGDWDLQGGYFDENGKWVQDSETQAWGRVIDWLEDKYSEEKEKIAMAKSNQVDAKLKETTDFIDERNEKGTWAEGDSESKAWERYKNWLVANHPEELGKIKEAEDKIFEAEKKEVEKELSDIEHEIDVNNATNGDSADNTEYYKSIQEIAHTEAEKRREELRASGIKEEEIEKDDEVQKWQKRWLDAQESIDDLRESDFNSKISKNDHDREKFDRENPDGDGSSYLQSNIDLAKSRIAGLDPEKDAEEIQELYEMIWGWEDEINNYREKGIKNSINSAEELYAIHQDESRYINDLTWILNNLNLTEEERLEIDEKIADAKKRQADNAISDIDDYINERNARNDWDAYGDSEVKAIQRQTKIIEEAYEQRLLTDEEYIKRLKENAQKIYSLGQDRVDKHLSDIDSYIDERNLYGDWDVYNDSEVEAIKLKFQILDEARKLDLISQEEYVEKTKECTRELYSVAKNDLIEEISKIIEEYEEIRQNEIDALSFESSQYGSLKTLLQSYYDVTNAVTDAQHEIDKELKASQVMYEYLNEETRGLLFNQEDYNTLSEELLDIQSAANELQKQYEEDILGASEETIAEITSQYQMQYETMMKQYEVAKAELDVAKKRQKLDNVLAERNVRMFVNGQWQWVANTQDVINAQNELADAENEKKKAVTSLNQAGSINELTGAQDALATQINYLETDLEEVRNYWADMQESLNGESTEVASALRQISKVSSPELKRILDVTGTDTEGFSSIVSESTTTMSDIINGDTGLKGVSTSIGDIVTDLQNFATAIQSLTDKINGIETNDNNKDGSSSSGGGSSSKDSSSNSSSSVSKTENAENIESNSPYSSNTDFDNERKYLDNLSKNGTAGEKAWAENQKKILDEEEAKHKHATGTRYTPGGFTALGEKGFEVYITNSGRLIPIDRPTIGNIGAGGIVFNREQMANLRNLWDLSSLGKISPYVSSSNASKQSTVIDNSIHINGLTVGEQGNEDWINGLRRYVATHK